MSRTRSAAPARAAWLAALVLTGAAAHEVHAQGISVVINNKTVAFPGTPPREIQGAVLVPLRGVFEQMGATVNYDPATKTIQAKKGSNNVSLVLGSTNALVNGQSQTLLQPATVIDGTTLVPLRFVAQSFGGYVQWLAASQTVQIRTPEEHLSTLPAPPPSAVDQGGQVIGDLTGVYTNTVPPQITLRVRGGQNTAVPITDATIVLIQHGDQQPVQQGINDLKVDRQVRITRNADGTAQVIQAVYGEVVGIIKSIMPQPDGSSMIALTDGSSVQILRGAPVTMGGRHLSLSDVMSAEKVVIRTDDENKHGTGVAVVTADDPNPTPPSLPLPTAPPGGQPFPRPGNPAPRPGPAPMPGPGAMPQPGTVPLPTVKPGAYLMPARVSDPSLMRLAADASVPTPGVTVSVTVQSFTTNLTGPVRGRELFHITLVGTPGGKAVYSIPNFTENAAMRETRPGVYEADYKAPVNLNITGAAIVGRLTAKDGSVSPTIPAPQTLTIDNAAPIISVVNPPTNATIVSPKPEIYALLSDGVGVGVDAQSVKLMLDGQDVTTQAALTKTAASYLPPSPLADGPHAVRLIVTDYLGNTAEKNWTFTVAAQPGSSLIFQSDQSGDHVDLSAGQSFGLTLHAPPGGKAAYSLGSVVLNAPFVETTPGVYTAIFKAQPGRSVENAPVVASFRPSSGAGVVIDLPQTVSVHAEPPRMPAIFLPEDGNDIGKTVTVAGRSAPDATIDVTIVYVSKTLGIFTVRGTAAQQQVVANNKGQWRTVEFQVMPVSLTSKTQNTTFTISASAIDATGLASDPAISKVQQE